MSGLNLNKAYIINISYASELHRPFLIIGDKQGIHNGLIDTNQEAKKALEACELKQGNCDGFKEYIAKKMAEAGLFKESTEIIHTIEDPMYISTTISYTASKLTEVAKAGVDKNKVIEAFKELMEAGDIIENPILRKGVINKITRQMKEAGLNKDRRDKVFRKAGIAPRQ